MTLGFLLYAVFFGIAWLNDLLKFYGPDIAFSAFFIFFLHQTFSFWRLNLPIYTLLILSFAAHLMGIFGWYNVSPLPIAWDHVTHGFPLFSFTAFLFNFARPWMDRFWSTKTWGVMLLVLLGGLGIGAVIENIEFAGYLTLGYGDGGLFFGGPGDGIPITSAQVDVIQQIGGGYINTEIDLLWNAIGTFVAMIVMSLIYFRKRVP